MKTQIQRLKVNHQIIKVGTLKAIHAPAIHPQILPTPTPIAAAQPHQVSLLALNPLGQTVATVLILIRQVINHLAAAMLHPPNKQARAKQAYRNQKQLIQMSSRRQNMKIVRSYLAVVRLVPQAKV